MTACSRGADASELYLAACPLRDERAQGRPGARCTRGPVCNGTRKCAHEHTGPAESIRPSLRNGLTAYGALFPETNSSCLRHRRIDGLANPVRLAKTSADLTPATGARTTRFCWARRKCAFAYPTLLDMSVVAAAETVRRSDTDRAAPPLLPGLDALPSAATTAAVLNHQRVDAAAAAV
jgi:hypothetical protein